MMPRIQDDWFGIDLARHNDDREANKRVEPAKHAEFYVSDAGNSIVRMYSPASEAHRRGYINVPFDVKDSMDRFVLGGWRVTYRVHIDRRKIADLDYETKMVPNLRKCFNGSTVHYRMWFNYQRKEE